MYLSLNLYTKMCILSIKRRIKKLHNHDIIFFMESFNQKNNELLINQEGLLVNYISYVKKELNDFMLKETKDPDILNDSNKLEILDSVSGKDFLLNHGFSDSSMDLKKNDKVLVFDFPKKISTAWFNGLDKNTEIKDLYEKIHEKLNEMLFSVDTRKSFRIKGISITRLNKHGQHKPGEYYYVARVRLDI